MKKAIRLSLIKSLKMAVCRLLKEKAPKRRLQRVDKPSHSLSVLCFGAHECQIRSAPVLVLPRLQGFSTTLKKRQRAKIKFILALCQQSNAS
ncbi:hypothetical protein EYW51_04015 [Bacillus altitudinis]|nr:hypothetical protein [Bacillus altitudinis]